MSESGPLTVAIDATPAAVPRRTGIATYIARLLQELPAVDPSTRYLSCYRLFRLLRRGRVPCASARNARRALFDERLPRFLLPRADVYHGADIRIPERISWPVVATIHDLYSLTSAELDTAEFTAKRSAQYERAAREARILITHSEHVRRELVRHLSVPEARVRAVPLGVDPVYAPHPAEDIGEWLFTHRLVYAEYVLVTGTVSRRKNPIGAVRAMARLREIRGPPLALVFAGKDHDQADAIREESERLGVADRVRLIGYAPAPLLAALYAGARALLFLSLDEGFGLPVLEAFASGVPVVAARRGAIPEVAGEAAWLVEPEDASAAAEALLEAVTDGPARAQRIARGLERAKAFTWAETARRTADVYRAALA